MSDAAEAIAVNGTGRPRASRQNSSQAANDPVANFVRARRSAGFAVYFRDCEGLSLFDQDHLDDVAEQINTRQRKTLAFRTPAAKPAAATPVLRQVRN